MRTGYKLKVLIKKFSYPELLKECKERGWVIPMAHEIGGVDYPYDEIWVSTLPVRVKDRKSHAYVYRQKSGNLLIANRNYLEHAIVLVKDGS